MSRIDDIRNSLRQLRVIKISRGIGIIVVIMVVVVVVVVDIL
jgi:hypothetical protein